MLCLRDGQVYRMNPRLVDKFIQQPGVSEEIESIHPTTTDASAYFFTNKGNCFMLDIAKLPETVKLKERGNLLTGLIAGLAEGEHAIALFCTRTDEIGALGEFLFVTKNGQVKRTSAAEYGLRRARFAAIHLKDGDEVVHMMRVHPGDEGDLILVTRSCMAVRFSLDSVPVTGRATAGVRGMQLVNEDAVEFVFQPQSGDMLLVVTDRGFGKRMLADDVERQNRGGKGQRLMVRNSATGLIMAGCIDVTHVNTVVIEQQSGQLTQIGTSEIAVERRSGKGQMLVSVLLDNVVVRVSAQG